MQMLISFYNDLFKFYDCGFFFYKRKNKFGVNNPIAGKGSS